MSFKKWLKSEETGEEVLDLENPSIKLVKVASGFTTPTALAHDGEKIYITDQTGVIRTGNTVFLDIRDTIKKLRPYSDDSERGGLDPEYDERGLLGLVFHPNYQKNGRFFIFHSTPREPLTKGLEIKDKERFNHDSVLVEYQAVNGRVNKSSRRELLRIPQEKATHNAGTLRFGPDGHLYISTGDGGCCGDQFSEIGNAQSLSTLKGKILRIDVNGGNPYRIPRDNPFVNMKAARPEIYAYGFRNPWQFSFDGNRLFCAQVGEGADEKGEGRECIFIVKKGGNHGWRIREGTLWFDKPLLKKLGLKKTDLVDPIYEYDHKDGKSIIGGYVYRGSIPSLKGAYIFGDWSAGSPKPMGKLWYLKQLNGKWKRFELKYPDDKDNLGLFVLAFGEGPDKELYVLTKKIVGLDKVTGSVYKIISA